MRHREFDIAHLYATHRQTVLLFLLRRTADTETALDLWAETFAQAVAGHKRFRGRTDDEAAGWLLGIAQRQLAQYYRRGHVEKKAMAKLGIERPPADALVEAELVRLAGLAEVRRELTSALAALTPETRAAIELRVVQELPYTDVARRLSISEQAARARVSRGLRALSDVLDPDTITEATRT
ncbi:MAG TPA: RNA polymerase sigma factor [Solirubrobacteraceae bacterium]|nr:RNA polymerase sigma factor [Solirubrobacteraceae bacterium]